MSPLTIVAYLVLCLMMGILGRRTRLGFFRSLLFSIMVTPLVIMLYLLLLATVDADARRKEEAKEGGGATPAKSGPE